MGLFTIDQEIETEGRALAESTFGFLYKCMMDGHDQDEALAHAIHFAARTARPHRKTNALLRAFKRALHAHDGFDRQTANAFAYKVTHAAITRTPLEGQTQ